MRVGLSLSGWLTVLTIALIGAVPAVLTAAGVRDLRWIVLWTAVAAIAAPLGKLAIDRLTRQLTHREDLEHQLAKQALGGGKYRMDMIRDPTLLGVHPAILIDVVPGPPGMTSKRMPSYVRRDQHEEIVRNLGPGSFVIVLGDSASGKTRAAFEATANTLPRHYVVAPQRRTELAVAVEAAATRRNSVLWLDDLERFIGADGLTVAAIDRVIAGARHHRVVVATMRTEELLSLDIVNPDRQLGVEQQRIVEQAVQVRLERLFSDEELTRARPLRGDPRIDDAMRQPRVYGLAEYLAAAPRLLDAWQNAWAPGTRPRSAALVHAAIECRLAGYLSPIPVALVEALHTEFLEDRGGARLRPERLAEAWEWATAPKNNSTTSLLQYVDTDHVVVFDYLIDHRQRTSGPDVAARRSVVEAALGASDASTSHDIARTAYRRGQYDVAREAFERTIALQTSAQGEDAVETLTARSEFARVLARLGQYASAAEEHRAVLTVRRRVLGADHADTLSTRNYLARTLDKLGLPEQAEAEFRAVFEARRHALGEDHPDTLNSRGSLAGVLGRRGEVELAERELRIVLEKRIAKIGPEHPFTLLTRNDIARLLVRRDGQEAVAQYRSVIDVRTRVLGAKHPETLDSRHELAVAWAEMGNHESAEAELEEVFGARCQVLGDNHPDTISARETLAKLRRRNELRPSQEN